MRTTIDIDDPILADLKRLQKREGKSLGRLVSDLLAQALATSKPAAAKKRPFQWHSSPAEPLVDLADREAVYDAVDEAPRR
jgi:hypothetical protein